MSNSAPLHESPVLGGMPYLFYTGIPEHSGAGKVIPTTGQTCCCQVPWPQLPGQQTYFLPGEMGQSLICFDLPTHLPYPRSTFFIFTFSCSPTPTTHRATFSGWKGIHHSELRWSEPMQLPLRSPQRPCTTAPTPFGPLEAPRP